MARRAVSRHDRRVDRRSHALIVLLVASTACASRDRVPEGLLTPLDVAPPSAPAITTQSPVAPIALPQEDPEIDFTPGRAPFDDPEVSRALLRDLAGNRPRSWGESVSGVRTRLDTSEAVMALTFDACGGPGGDEYDAGLIALLRRERVPATLFLSAKWIDAHADVAAELAADPLFEIESHGLAHKPCSVVGASAHGLRGTQSPRAAIAEIAGGARRIRDLTRRTPLFHRAGTAFWDELCARASSRLGLTPMGYTVSADAARGFSAAGVRDALTAAPSGAIVLMHMNHPRGGTAEGVERALPLLATRGVRFVRLAEVATK
jgi:peptidoglycan/xylan/chitin deacetylase (PgdA/CDA1 family)